MGVVWRTRDHVSTRGEGTWRDFAVLQCSCVFLQELLNTRNPSRFPSDPLLFHWWWLIHILGANCTNEPLPKRLLRPFSPRSIWSMTDNLYDDVPKHWSGRDVGLTGMIRIDGKVYRYEHVQYLLLCMQV